MSITENTIVVPFGRRYVDRLPPDPGQKAGLASAEIAKNSDMGNHISGESVANSAYAATNSIADEVKA